MHARAILGLPVDVTLASPGASAVIYGQLDQPAIGFENVAAALAVPETDIRLFGKPESFHRRRMGVVTATADDVPAARERAVRAASLVLPVPGRAAVRKATVLPPPARPHRRAVPAPARTRRPAARARRSSAGVAGPRPVVPSRRPVVPSRHPAGRYRRPARVRLPDPPAVPPDPEVPEVSGRSHLPGHPVPQVLPVRRPRDSPRSWRRW
ncbi:hypothetical protein [Gordonia sp. CNJ-863]|uniref:hypothetical protein n=1 Tax=Gordonia sp. CNJ-863 TaxID=1904963 RepID=UPI0021CB3373|nr:hypothetical protein [Gordonia sp. CNJ-863]